MVASLNPNFAPIPLSTAMADAEFPAGLVGSEADLAARLGYVSELKGSGPYVRCSCRWSHRGYALSVHEVLSGSCRRVKKINGGGPINYRNDPTSIFWTPLTTWSTSIKLPIPL